MHTILLLSEFSSTSRVPPGRGRSLLPKGFFHLLGFSDVDWADCPDSRRSVSCQCFFRGKSLMYHCSSLLNFDLV